MSNNFLVDFTFGGISATVSETITYGPDRVKFLLAMGPFRPGKPARPYTGLWNCVFRVAKEEGILFFWRGNMVNLAKSAPQQAFNLSFKEKYKNFLNSRSKDFRCSDNCFKTF